MEVTACCDTSSRNASSAEPATGTRVCCVCLVEKPLHRFRRTSRADDTRAYQCNRCHARRERVRRSGLRVKRRDRVIAGFQTAVTQATSFRRVEFLVSAMLHRFGGPARFAAIWHQHLTNWIKERPASKSVLMGLRAITQLAQFVDDRQLQQSADEEEPLVGEADLARTLREAIEDLIQTQPELAIAAAERAGWTVIPPN